MSERETTVAAIDKVIKSMCANPGRQFSKDDHAKKLNDVIQSTTFPRKIADLFITVTMISTPFTGAHSKDSYEALNDLIKEEGAVVDNLLHCILKMKDDEQKLTVIDFSAGSKTKTTKVSFKKQRALAKKELEKRGNPPYNADAYLP